MPSATPHPSDAELAGLLIAASSRSGRSAVPPGQRGPLVSLLTKIMADGRRLDSYVAVLKAKLQARDVAGEDRESVEADERDERIAAEGFSWLPDEELAALAVSPRALEALYRLLEEPETETGEWLMDAMMAAHADRPEVLELEDRTRRRLAKLLEDEKPTVIPFPPERTPRRWAAEAVRWGVRPASLAASLLVGVLLGATAFRNGEPSSFDVSVASAPTPTLGAKERPGVNIESAGEGFAAVVALAPGRRPQVVPDLGVDDVPVRGGSPAHVQLPDAATEALIVVTETPASEPLRRAIRDKAFGPGQLDSLKTFVRAALEAKGFRRMALETTTIPE